MSAAEKSPRFKRQIFASAPGNRMTDTRTRVCSRVCPQNVPSSSKKSPGKPMIQLKLFRVRLPFASHTQHVPAPAKCFVEVNQKDPPPPSREVDKNDPALGGSR